MPSAPGSPADEFVELGQFQLDAKSIRELDLDYCSRHGIVVLGRIPVAGDVTVGMLKPQDLGLVEQVAAALGRPVLPVRLHRHEIDRALAVGYPRPDADRASLLLKPVHRVSYQPDRDTTRLVQEALAQAITLGASDVHFETYRDDVDVRLRIDGVLRQVTTPISYEGVRSAISYLKILSGLDIAERRRAQDGRILVQFVDPAGGVRDVDLRLSVLPGPQGEDAVVRILDNRRPELGLEALGFDPETAQRFHDVIESPEGMVLITGPTGSGKTTTLYAALQRVNRDDNKLLTVENPIEYELPKANQKQVGPAMGFADYARAFMRHDPDILMIGEIRDEETAALAIRAAQTGHLVLSTLHTRDSVGAVPRLATLGVEPLMIADALVAVLAQRLVRRVCQECRREVAADPRLLHRLGIETLDFPIYEGRGCEACGHDGYKGRLGVFELFVVDGPAAHQIAGGRPPHQIRLGARKRGLRTLLDDALAKLRQGVTSLSEVARNVPYALARERRQP